MLKFYFVIPTDSAQQQVMFSDLYLRTKAGVNVLHDGAATSNNSSVTADNAFDTDMLSKCQLESGNYLAYEFNDSVQLGDLSAFELSGALISAQPPHDFDVYIDMGDGALHQLVRARGVQWQYDFQIQKITVNPALVAWPDILTGTTGTGTAAAVDPATTATTNTGTTATVDPATTATTSTGTTATAVPVTTATTSTGTTATADPATTATTSTGTTATADPATTATTGTETAATTNLTDEVDFVAVVTQSDSGEILKVDLNKASVMFVNGRTKSYVATVTYKDGLLVSVVPLNHHGGDLLSIAPISIVSTVDDKVLVAGLRKAQKTRALTPLEATTVLLKSSSAANYADTLISKSAAESGYTNLRLAGFDDAAAKQICTHYGVQVLARDYLAEEQLQIATSNFGQLTKLLNYLAAKNVAYPDFELYINALRNDPAVMAVVADAGLKVKR